MKVRKACRSRNTQADAPIRGPAFWQRTRPLTAVCAVLVLLVVTCTSSFLHGQWQSAQRLELQQARQLTRGLHGALIAALNGPVLDILAGSALALLTVGAAHLFARRALRRLDARDAALDEHRQHLASRDRELRMVVESLGALVFRTDRDGAISYVNPRWEAITGLGAQDVIGLRLSGLCSAADHQRLDTLFDPQAESHGNPVLVRLDVNDRSVTLEVSTAKLRDARNRLLGFAGYAVDVSERQLVRERLQDQLDFTARLLELSPSPLFAKDEQGRFTQVNRAFLDLVQLPVHQVLGRTAERLFIEQAKTPQPSDGPALYSGDCFSHEAQLIRNDGLRRDVVVTMARLRHGDGRPAGFAGSVNDITVYRDAERLVREARDDTVRAAKAKLDFERGFLSMVAHELRTPLTGLRLQAELLRSATTLAERMAYGSEIVASVDRIGHVLEQLMILSRVDGLKYSELDRVEVGLEAAYIKVMSLLQEEAAERGLQIKSRLKSHRLQGVAFAVHTVLRNLLHNAILYTPVGGRVEVSAERSDQGLALIVDDSGPGIAPELRDKAFDRFDRLGQQQVKGSGLGLSIVKSIASLHGATVTLSTSPLGGLRVTLAFPAQPPKLAQFLESSLGPLPLADDPRDPRLTPRRRAQGRDRRLVRPA